MFFGFGIWEVLIVAAVILLLFNKRIPATFRSIGKSIVEFKKGIRDTDSNDSSGKDSHAD